MDKGPDGYSWLWMFGYATFAAFGGVLGYIMRTLDNKEKVSWARALLEAFGAAFVGVLVMFICQAMNMSAQWTGVIVGVCGWLGAAASIRMLERVVSRKIGAGDDPVK